MKQILGTILILLPFVALFAFLIYMEGIKFLFLLIGIAFILVGIPTAGVYLLHSYEEDRKK